MTEIICNYGNAKIAGALSMANNEQTGAGQRSWKEGKGLD